MLLVAPVVLFTETTVVMLLVALVVLFTETMEGDASGSSSGAVYGNYGGDASGSSSGAVYGKLWR